MSDLQKYTEKLEKLEKESVVYLNDLVEYLNKLNEKGKIKWKRN